MFFIKFLKIPNITLKNKQHALVASVTVTSDLGDIFLDKDVVLEVLLCLVTILRPGHVTQTHLAAKAVPWRAGMRNLPLAFDIPRPWINVPFHVCVRCKEAHDASASTKIASLSQNYLHLHILPVWSAPLHISKGCLSAEPTAQRRIPHAGGLLHIWEQTGDSIARHIWDAGYVLTAYISAVIAAPSTGMPLLRDALTRRCGTPLDILELGTGCGVVGLYLACVLPNCHVTMTDLPDAEEIARRNIALAAPARFSRAEFVVHDWSAPVPDVVARRRFGWVFVVDCTYNPDSIPHLVKTLEAVARTSPGVRVCVATKVRHPSEAVFFDLMAEAGFVVRERDGVDIVDQAAEISDGDASALIDVIASERIEMCIFTRRALDVNGSTSE